MPNLFGLLKSVTDTAICRKDQQSGRRLASVFERNAARLRQAFGHSRNYVNPATLERSDTTGRKLTSGQRTVLAALHYCANRPATTADGLRALFPALTLKEREQTIAYVTSLREQYDESAERGLIVTVSYPKGTQHLIALAPWADSRAS